MLSSMEIDFAVCTHQQRCEYNFNKIYNQFYLLYGFQKWFWYLDCFKFVDNFKEVNAVVRPMWLPLPLSLDWHTFQHIQHILYLLDMDVNFRIWTQTNQYFALPKWKRKWKCFSSWIGYWYHNCICYVKCEHIFSILF